MQFDLSYNPNIVTAVSVVEGNLLHQGGASTYFNAGQINNVAGTIAGVFGVIISPGQMVSTASTFAVITMTAGSAGGSCPLTLSNVVIGDIGGHSVPVTLTNGTIRVDRAPVIGWADTKILARDADSVLLVLQPDTSKIDLAIESKQTLESVNAHVEGFILNGVVTGNVQSKLREEQTPAS